MTQTLHQIEHELNLLSNLVHSRSINFLMMEVPKEPADLTQDNGLIIEHRRQFLYEHQFEDKLKLITFIQLMMVTLKKWTYF